MAISATTPAVAAASSSASATLAAPATKTDSLTSAKEQSDRFLKLLVAQMKNQDPLNPMDNAQVTTQMAQISTVSGIDKLSATMATVNASLLQVQSLEGASMVGRTVMVEGSLLSLNDKGKTSAGFELESRAASVLATIKDGSGKVLDTLDLGAMPAGRHTFEWASADANAKGLTFEISALNKDKAVGVTRLVADQVDSVFMDKGLLWLELGSNGTIAFGKIKGVS